MKKHRLLLGAHMSVAGGYEKAYEHAQSIGCTVMQIFTKSNRQWQSKKITAEQSALFISAAQKSAISVAIAHATYLINIGSPDTAVRTKSINALVDELERCALLDIPYLVLHPGSSTGSALEECLDTIAESLGQALEKASSKTEILLEIMAGQGSTVCYSFEQIAYVLKQAKHSNRIGVCFDTCHAFAAGYDFRDATNYQIMWKAFDTIIGRKKLKAIHLNDSKKEIGSRVDRHEEIGKGQLGLEAFRLLMNDEHLFDIPKILETPQDDLADYEKNMKILMGLLSKETRKKLGL